MKNKILQTLLASLICILFSSCKRPNKDTNSPILPPQPALQTTKTINYNDYSVDLVIDKPEGDTMDVLMVFHGTVQYDSLILAAAHNTLDAFKKLLDNKQIMLISVAYPEENLLIGDNIAHSEAALLWLKNKAKEELSIDVRKIFLAGHSQGGYIVSRLNTMHPTQGVIANAPGPLNLVYRCQLEENGQIPNGSACTLLRNQYGTTSANPAAYHQRSLLHFTQGFLSDILYVQGLNDSPIQMYSWPLFKTEINNCSSCQKIQILELPGLGHNALFNSSEAKAAFNTFIQDRL